MHVLVFHCTAREKESEKPPTWALSKFLKDISKSKENVGKKSLG